MGPRDGPPARRPSRTQETERPGPSPMKELAIHHEVPKKGQRRPRVRVSYRPQEGAQAQDRTVKRFAFTVTDKQRQLIQWYLEEFLICPYGEFLTRAQGAEQEMEQLG